MALSNADRRALGLRPNRPPRKTPMQRREQQEQLQKICNELLAKSQTPEGKPPDVPPANLPTVPGPAPATGAPPDVDDEAPRRATSCTLVVRTQSGRDTFVPLGNCVENPTNHLCGGDHVQVSHCSRCGRTMRDRPL